ncbi:hypothetical protein P3342_003202 [Pyrenophora teres f. teres]|nr:hypothetical protein P3342_003202 [Pyrenophora teres f. teres]
MEGATLASGQIELNADVKAAIVDHIGVYSDLRALALTCKDWNYLVTKRLYENIVFDIRNPDGQLLAFQQCLAIGAWRNLQYARSLSLLDIWPESSITCKLPPPKEWDPREKVLLLLDVLQSFPKNKLRRFRYLSLSPINAAIVNLLAQSQQSIEELHVPCGSLQRLISPKTRQLTAAFKSEHEQTDGFVEIALATSALESLTLVHVQDMFMFDMFEDVDPDAVVEVYWKDSVNSILFDHKKFVTSQLTIQGCLPLTFPPTIFDMSKLTRLAFFDCRFSLAKNLCCSPDLQNLTHFTLYTHDDISELDIISLRTMFLRNQGIHHLCLHFPGLSKTPLEPRVSDAEGLPNAHSSYLWPTRNSLRTLSLFDECSLFDNDEELLSKSSLEFVCKEIHGLNQLAIRAPELQHRNSRSILKLKRYRHEFVLEYLEPIKYLKGLNILQLYQPQLRAVPKAKVRADPALNTQEFATLFFQWAHASCPHLKVLVWGLSKETPDSAVIDCLRTDDMEVRTDSINGVEKIPQQYFIKQVVEVYNGATQISAVAVPRSRIREDFPELDIISCDTIWFDPLARLAREDDVDLNNSSVLKHKAGCGLAQRNIG